MKSIHTLIIICVFLLLSSNFTSAQWVQTNGPYGGDIYSLIIVPDGSGSTNLFAGTYGAGVFRSSDKGENWISVNNGLTWNSCFRRVSAFAYGINNTGDVHLFTALNQGVYRTTDNGENWHPFTYNLPVPTSVKALTVCPKTSGGFDLFAGIWNSNFNGIYHIADNGSTWDNITYNFPPGIQINSLAVSPDGNYIFVGTSRGVYRLTKNGNCWTASNNSWDPVNSGLCDVSGVPHYVYTLSVSGTEIYAGTGKGIFTATIANSILWNEIYYDINNVPIYSLLPFSDGTSRYLFAGTVYGVYFYDYNNPCIPVNNGLTDNQLVVRAMAVDTNNVNSIDIYAGTGQKWGRSYWGYLRFVDFIYFCPDSFILFGFSFSLNNCFHIPEH